MNRHRGREGSNWVLYQRGSEGVEGMSRPGGDIWTWNSARWGYQRMIKNNNLLVST